MKKYKLKQWYPSLYEDIEEGIEVEYKNGWIYYVNTRGNKTCVEFDEYEFNFTDYWEEVKQPLFITEDGVDYYKFDFAVGFNIHNQFTINHNDWREQDLNNFKIFANKSNADKYLWRNKRVFSYEDMMKAKHSIILADEDIERAAKERICNG